MNKTEYICEKLYEIEKEEDATQRMVICQTLRAYIRLNGDK